MMRLTMANPRPVPRFLVEKYGRKSFSLSSRVTPCPVSATEISTASRLATNAVEISISRTRESCRASAALSTRLATARLMDSASARTRGRSGVRDLCRLIPSRRPLNIESAFSITSLISAGWGFGGGKGCQGGELVDQAADGFGGAGYGFSARANYLERSGIGGSGAFQVAADAFGGKRDGSEWVLDLVSHAAGHFTPCGLLLCLEQVRQIFEHDYVA